MSLKASTRSVFSFLIIGIAFLCSQAAVAATVSGTITPSNYASGSKVVLRSYWRVVSSTTVDANGAFRFTGVANGYYQVQPSKSGFKFSPQSKSVRVNNADVSGISFTISPRYYAISGMIAGGAGATVSLTGSGTATTIADANGV